MRIALLLVLFGLSAMSVGAEDWTTSDGKTYKDVKVVSHDAAYVTILHADGGGRVLLATLNPDLQKRFGYDPVKAAAAIAAVAASDQRDKDALAQEKAQAQAQAAQGQSQVNDAVAAAAVPPPPPDANTPEQPSGPVADTTTSGDSSAPPTDDPAYGTQTQIDDGYGYYGGYYPGYVGYGYGSYGYGNGNHGGGYRSWGSHAGSGYSRGAVNTGTSTAAQQTPTPPAAIHLGAVAIRPGVTGATTGPTQVPRH